MSYAAKAAGGDRPAAAKATPQWLHIGGEVTGSRVSGKLRPVGGDWVTVRRGGIAILDVIATIETNDAALIYLSYAGVIDLGENGGEQFSKGIMPTSGTPIRTSPRLHTAHPTYSWLNRLHCLVVGQAFLERSEVAYDVYAVR